MKPLAEDAEMHAKLEYNRREWERHEVARSAMIDDFHRRVMLPWNGVEYAILCDQEPAIVFGFRNNNPDCLVFPFYTKPIPFGVYATNHIMHPTLVPPPIQRMIRLSVEFWIVTRESAVCILDETPT